MNQKKGRSQELPEDRPNHQYNYQYQPEKGWRSTASRIGSKAGAARNWGEGEGEINPPSAPRSTSIGSSISNPPRINNLPVDLGPAEGTKNQRLTCPPNCRKASRHSQSLSPHGRSSSPPPPTAPARLASHPGTRAGRSAGSGPRPVHDSRVAPGCPVTPPSEPASSRRSS